MITRMKISKVSLTIIAEAWCLGFSECDSTENTIKPVVANANNKIPINEENLTC